MAKCGKGQIWNKKLSKCVISSRSKAKQELKKEDPEFMSKKRRSESAKKGAKYGAVAGGSLTAGYVRGKTKGRCHFDATTFEGGVVGSKKRRNPRPTSKAGDVALTAVGTAAGGYLGAAAGYGARRLKEEYKIQKRASKIRKKRRKKGNK